jgi:hypothetical protein
MHETPEHTPSNKTFAIFSGYFATYALTPIPRVTGRFHKSLAKLDYYNNRPSTVNLSENDRIILLHANRTQARPRWK